MLCAPGLAKKKGKHHFNPTWDNQSCRHSGPRSRRSAVLVGRDHFFLTFVSIVPELRVKFKLEVKRYINR